MRVILAAPTVAMVMFLFLGFASLRAESEAIQWSMKLDCFVALRFARAPRNDEINRESPAAGARSAGRAACGRPHDPRHAGSGQASRHRSRPSRRPGAP